MYFGFMLANQMQKRDKKHGENLINQHTVVGSIGVTNI